MKLSHLRDEQYAIAQSRKQRLFFWRLTPEFIWEQVRFQVIEELKQELQARGST